MILTADNYHSPEANQAYFSVSQYKDFVGMWGRKGCEAMALAKIKGEWKQEMTTPLLVGSYVDAHFEGTLDVFKAKHPELLKKDGELKADYLHANEVIARIERDPYFMNFLSGQKQKIFTADIFGVPWKIKVDSLDPEQYIADLKVMRGIRESFWVRDLGHITFVEYWSYDIQAAVYQKVVEINIRKQLPFFIAAATKENYPDIAIIGFTQHDLDNILSTVVPNIERIKQLKSGEVEPLRCEGCDFCRATKVLTKAIHFSELILNI